LARDDRRRAAERAVLKELRAREPIFHRPGHYASRALREAALDAGFWEVGASGRRYSRAYVLRMLAARLAAGAEDRWRAHGFRCRELARGLYLLTYTLEQGERCTRRSTLWQRHAGAWRILYHQGTLVTETKE